MPARRDRVLAEMRLGPMGAYPLEGHEPCVGRGKLRTGRHRHFVGAQTRHVVQAIDGIAGKDVEEPIFDHLLCPATAFLRRLEDEMHRPGEIPGFCQMARSPEQQRRMPVMSAGMHLSGKLRFVGTFRLLRHRQCIHVGAKADGSRAVAHLQSADDARLP
jgi:hypothetical protein